LRGEKRRKEEERELTKGQRRKEEKMGFSCLAAAPPHPPPCRNAKVARPGGVKPNPLGPKTALVFCVFDV
jgi:hypothetical protein